MIVSYNGKQTTIPVSGSLGAALLGMVRRVEPSAAHIHVRQAAYEPSRKSYQCEFCATDATDAILLDNVVAHLRLEDDDPPVLVGEPEQDARTQEWRVRVHVRGQCVAVRGDTAEDALRQAQLIAATSALKPHMTIYQAAISSGVDYDREPGT
jgi:hypothetical protein